MKFSIATLLILINYLVSAKPFLPNGLESKNVTNIESSSSVLGSMYQADVNLATSNQTNSTKDETNDLPFFLTKDDIKNFNIENDDEDDYFAEPDLYMQAINELNEIIQFSLKVSPNNWYMILDELKNKQIFGALFRDMDTNDLVELRDKIGDFIESLFEAKEENENVIDDQVNEKYEKLKELYEQSLDLLRKSVRIIKKQNPVNYI